MGKKRRFFWQRNKCLQCGASCKEDFCSQACRDWYMWHLNRSDKAFEDDGAKPPFYPDGMKSWR